MRSISGVQPAPNNKKTLDSRRVLLAWNVNICLLDGSRLTSNNFKEVGNFGNCLELDFLGEESNDLN